MVNFTETMKKEINVINSLGLDLPHTALSNLLVFWSPVLSQDSCKSTGSQITTQYEIFKIYFYWNISLLFRF